MVNVAMLGDYELVEGCRKQDRTMQRQLYEQYAGKLFVVSKRYTKDATGAEDVLQDSFVKIYHYIEQFRFDCPLEAWLKRIVINTALKYLRTQQHWDQAADINEMAPLLSQDDLSLPTLNYQYLLALIQELPPGCRAVFNLFAIEGYSHPEIGEMLSISEGTSKSQYSRARALLQYKLQLDGRSSEPRSTEQQR